MTNTTKKPNLLNILLWIAQGLLTAILISGGLMKLLLPDSLPFMWMKEHPHLNTFTSILDILAGLGLLLPGLLKIKPILGVYSALGTMALMLSAILFHVARGEASDIGFSIFILLLAILVAWGRGIKRPIV